MNFFGKNADLSRSHLIIGLEAKPFPRSVDVHQKARPE